MAIEQSTKATVLLPVRLPIVRLGQRLERILPQALRKNRFTLSDNDVIAIASKVVSVAERRIIALDEVEVSERVVRIARKWRIDRKLAALVLDEADAVIGGVPGFLLTIKNGILTANAGIDLKNSPDRTAMRWPRDADASAAAMRNSLEREFRARLGVIIVDSRVTPLRLGTVGLAIGVSGIVPLRDHRRIRDLYGRKTKVTQTNVVDDLASSAHLLMGETREQIGAVVVRNAPVLFREDTNSRSARLAMRRCLIASNFNVRGR